MLRLSILSARGRLGTFTGALIALFAASVLAMAWGMQLESMLRTHPPVERYAAAAAVVAGQQNVGADHDVQLTERARVSTALTARLAGLPGVRAAIGDVSVPAWLGDRAAVAHGWSSAALTPYVLSAGRPPAGPDEVVTGYPAALGARLPLASTARTRMVTVVGVARPRHPVTQQSAIFLTDAEATALAGHPGRVDAIGLLAGPGFDINRVRAAASGAQVLTGAARGQGEYPELEATRTTLIPVTAAFGGLALFIAMFVVASTLGLSIQQREREIALLRAVAATPGQIRRMIAWEAAIIALIGSAAGIWPGIVLGRTLAHGLVRHGIAPPNFALNYDWLPAAAVIGCAVATSLLAVLAAGRRAARVPPTLALTDAAVEPRLLGPGRIIGGLLALACAVPLFTVSVTTSTPDTAAATAEMTAIFLVVAVGFLGPIFAYVVARLLAPALGALSPVGGFLASANLRTAARRFSSASTPLVLTVAMSCTLLFSTTTIEHATTQQRHAGLTGQLAITSTGPGLPAAALADARATPGVRSAVALTSTTLGPGLGDSDDTLPAQILAGGQGGGLDVGVTAGSLNALHGNTIALGRRRANAVHARRRRTRPDHARRRHTRPRHRRRRSTAATWPSETLCSPPSSPPATRPARCSGRSSSKQTTPAAVARRLRALATRYPGLKVSDRATLATATDAEDEMNRWFGPQFVAEIFAFTSIAVITTLIMIALRRRRELGLLRLVGATPRQVRSMARWEAALIITIGLGIGLAIAATALLPLSQALNGGLPYVPAGPVRRRSSASQRSWRYWPLRCQRGERSAPRPIEAIGARE